jgi:S-adenosylmethionine hydrolase
MIVLFTDFGLHGPYTGQMKAVLEQMAPGTPVIDLFADAPTGNPRASAYLLAAYAIGFRNRMLRRARTFSDLPPGMAFWYENSNGLVEIAVNQGHADLDLGLASEAPSKLPLDPKQRRSKVDA